MRIPAPLARRSFLAIGLLLAMLGWGQAHDDPIGAELLSLPAGPAAIGIAILPACAPQGAPRDWARRLSAWGFAVRLYSDSRRARECEPETLDRASLNGFRQAAMDLAHHAGQGDVTLFALGWDTRLLIHASASVFGGRDLFRGIVALGADVPTIGSPLPILRGEEANPAAIRAFLESQHAVASSGVPASPPTSGQWVEYPGSPGPDLPETGVSLFDQLYARDGGHHVPFPISDLIADLNSRLGPATSDRKVLHALLPQGRSLQRHAAREQGFLYPRVVLGIDRFPDESDGLWRPLLRDRLFIAYQETSEVLEVISFNSVAGRFEFQVVHDYAADAKPRVLYAPRRLCMSCHQNAGPVFSEAPWDETADNPRVASRIRDIEPLPYGLPVPVADNQALSLDTSTDRANLLPLQARLWREACGNEQTQRIRCRAAGMLRMLQYRLSRQLDYDREGADYLKDYRAASAASWGARWPMGLHIASPDIPNRDVARDGLAIRPRLDPLRRRPPMATLSPDQEGIDHFIEGLAAQIPQSDLAAIDRHLIESTRIRRRDARRWQAPCRIEKQFERLGMVTRTIDCDSVELGLRGTFRSDRSNRPVDGTVDSLIVGQGKRVGELLAKSGLDGMGYTLSFWGSPFGVRPAPGRLVIRLELDWNVVGARAILQTASDMESLAAALATLAARPVEDNVFASDVFQPRQLVRAVLAVLGIESLSPPPSRSVRMRPRLEPTSVSGADRRLVPFVRHCAPCHAGERSFPPPFLSGPPASVLDRVAICAPRMLRRLSMWRVAPGSRAMTPMPPPIALDDVRGYELADSLIPLLREIAPEAHSDPTQPYENLAPCM